MKILVVNLHSSAAAVRSDSIASQIGSNPL